MANKPKFLSENGLQYMITYIKNLLGSKVDKETGKGLSANDYSNTEKEKLNNIEAGSQVNIIENIKVNNVTQAIDSKTVNITVPTNNNQLTNGAGYQTSTDVSDAIAAALQGVTGFQFEVVTELPVTGESGIIYLVSHSHGTNDGYDEYVWINNSFEKLGHADVDLSGYVETMDVITNSQIDAMFNA